MTALAGLRVIDLTRILAGPFCTQWLGDHGADVIKVEPPSGDDTRTWGPPFDETTGAASYYMGVNRNKRSMSLDLGTDAGRDVLMRLLEDADILIENYKIGQMEKWGLGHESLMDRFPGLITCRISGFGEDGPLGGLPGYDAVVQAQAGLMSVNGEEGGPPTRLGIPLVDICLGMSALSGLLMAVIERQNSGKGQMLDINLYDTAVSVLFPYGVNYLFGGAVPRPLGNAHPNITPYDTFPTATRPVFIAGANDRQFARLCEVLGRPELAERPEYASNGLRNANRESLTPELIELTKAWDGEELAQKLMEAGVPAGPVMDVPGVFEHPHTRHRGLMLDIDGYRAPGNPIHLKRTPAEAARMRPRAFGADTRTVLEEAGYDTDQIETMVANGTVKVDS